MKNTYPILIFASCLLVYGCVTDDGVIGNSELPDPEAGFVAFPTARQFDPPGQMYRIDGNGVVFPVTTLAVAIESGNEAIPRRTELRQTDIGGFLRLIGLAFCQARLQAGRTTTANVTMETVEGLREFTQDDSGIVEAASDYLSTNGYDPNSTYFVIRETISAEEISYRAELSWLTSAGASECIEGAVEPGGDLRFTRADIAELDRTFDEPYRLWYKPERLVPRVGPGIGPNDLPVFQLTPMEHSPLQ